MAMTIQPNPIKHGGPEKIVEINESKWKKGKLQPWKGPKSWILGIWYCPKRKPPIHSLGCRNENGAHTNAMEGDWGVWEANFKQMRSCCNIETCKLHLDKIMHRGQYTSDIFAWLLEDIAFFYNVSIL